MLTELDNCILGLVWRQGPMSAYDVRSHLGRSTTVTWSSSTGTVYPAIRRLVEAGLLEASEQSGPRKTRSLSLTKAGSDALQLWLTKVSSELGSATADPIRTRVHFLGALKEDERAKALADYRQVTEATIRTIETYAALPATTEFERSERLGTMGVLAELRARRDWLEEVEEELATPRSGG